MANRRSASAETAGDRRNPHGPGSLSHVDFREPAAPVLRDARILPRGLWVGDLRGTGTACLVFWLANCRRSARNSVCEVRVSPRRTGGAPTMDSAILLSVLE